MNEINIPVVTGPGSQPQEMDGAELDILQLPSGMDTFETPILPEPEDIAGLDIGKRCLSRLLKQLQAYAGTVEAVKPIDLTALDSANRDLIDQVLGEGEVSILFDGRVRARIQESVLAGVWRVRYIDHEEKVQRDTIEIGEVPLLVREQAFSGTAGGIEDSLEALPEGVLNAPSLLTEINDKVVDYLPGSEAHVINLTLLPQTEQDLEFLAARLGQGSVTVLSRGYGNCRISSTATESVWWVQYFNSQDRNILNTLEVVDVPNVACAAVEDIHDSAIRLAEILEIYQ